MLESICELEYDPGYGRRTYIYLLWRSGIEACRFYLDTGYTIVALNAETENHSYHELFPFTLRSFLKSSHLPSKSAMLFAVHFLFPESSARYTLLIQTPAEGLGSRRTGAKLKMREGSLCQGEQCFSWSISGNGLMTVESWALSTSWTVAASANLVLPVGLWPQSLALHLHRHCSCFAVLFCSENKSFPSGEFPQDLTLKLSLRPRWRGWVLVASTSSRELKWWLQNVS